MRSSMIMRASMFLMNSHPAGFESVPDPGPVVVPWPIVCHSKSVHL
jgi:hypothetical protein